MYARNKVQISTLTKNVNSRDNNHISVISYELWNYQMKWQLSRVMTLFMTVEIWILFQPWVQRLSSTKLQNMFLRVPQYASPFHFPALPPSSLGLRQPPAALASSWPGCSTDRPSRGRPGRSGRLTCSRCAHYLKYSVEFTRYEKTGL